MLINVPGTIQHKTGLSGFTVLSIRVIQKRTAAADVKSQIQSVSIHYQNVPYPFTTTSIVLRCLPPH
jgi:hypothetical protein